MPTALAFGALLSIAFTGAATCSDESPWADQTNSKVRLVSGTISRDGAEVPYAGVQLRMDPGWKTYWRNPGDSGVPPTLTGRARRT
ncbi:MAG: hypothetical protein R3D01_02235 [Hyphomicrobiales bacterium]